MAVFSDITTVALATAAGHGFSLVQFTGADGRKRALFEKFLTGSGPISGGWLRAHGDDATSATTARTTALAALNAQRKHRYAGAPGTTGTPTVSAALHGETLVTDIT